MTLEDIIQIIRERLAGEQEKKATGKVEFEVNLSQGGIGECKIRTEGRVNNA